MVPGWVRRSEIRTVDSLSVLKAGMPRNAGPRIAWVVIDSLGRGQEPCEVPWHPGRMELDRAPGRFWDVHLQLAIRMSRDSTDEARRLLSAGFPGPAYVWAVRSVEIFVKEVMLRPAFIEEIEGTPDEFDKVWKLADRKVRSLFKGGKWDQALNKVESSFGPLDPLPPTTDGEDVWKVWKSKVVSQRGDVVHGAAADPSVDQAALVVEWADQMRTQLTLRLIASTTHPLHDLFVAFFDMAKQAQGGEQGATGSAPPASA